MTLDEMSRRMRDHEWREDWIVKIKYKYDWEKKYSYEIRVLQYDAESDNWFWDTDWNEGQTDCSVVWMIPLQDIELNHLEESAIKVLADIMPAEYCFDQPGFCSPSCKCRYENTCDPERAIRDFIERWNHEADEFAGG